MMGECIDIDITGGVRNNSSLFTFRTDTTTYCVEASPPMVLFEVNKNGSIEGDQAAPSSDGDRSISDTSLFSDLSAHLLSDESSSEETSWHEPPSMEAMEATVLNLSRSMLQTAQTRAMVYKHVFPDVRLKAMERQRRMKPAYGCSSWQKLDTLASNPPHNQLERELFKLEDSSICKFLRASKKFI